MYALGMQKAYGRREGVRLKGAAGRFTVPCRVGLDAVNDLRGAHPALQPCRYHPVAAYHLPQEGHKLREKADVT